MMRFGDRRVPVVSQIVDWLGSGRQFPTCRLFIPNPFSMRPVPVMRTGALGEIWPAAGTTSRSIQHGEVLPQTALLAQVRHEEGQEPVKCF